MIYKKIDAIFHDMHLSHKIHVILYHSFKYENKNNYVKDFFDYKTIINGELEDSKEVTEGFCENYIKRYLNGYIDEDGSFNKCCNNALSHITSLKSKPEIDIYGFCEYTNYWFYGKLKSTDKITNYMTLLQNFFEYLDNFEDCLNNTEDIDDRTYSNLEKLVELYEKFYDFEKEPSSHDHILCGKGQICVREYMKHEDTCKRNGDNSFCNELENFRERFNTHLKSIKKCDNIEELPSFQGSSLAATISLPVSVMSVISLFSLITYKVSTFFVQK
ncbi:hypothetical protein PVIIG_05936 [Plasmodium vivax India VII]|uniref:Uncharacterized protein n=1 Tax=Plasmodium vivax India VII TaxID=1077284 RepID=A0A0J9SG60_PLAVI|nr:hypothetical protein PVIIG_05936 [Plasmodium vivax India VII]